MYLFIVILKIFENIVVFNNFLIDFFIVFLGDIFGESLCFLKFLLL